MKKFLVVTLALLSSSVALHSAGALRRSAVRLGAVAALSTAAAVHKATAPRAEAAGGYVGIGPDSWSGGPALVATPKEPPVSDAALCSALNKPSAGEVTPGSSLEWKEYYYIEEKQQAAKLVEAFKKSHSEVDLKVAIAFLTELYKKLEARKDPTVMEVGAAEMLAGMTDPLLRIYGWQTLIDAKLLDDAFHLVQPMCQDEWTYSTSRVSALLRGFKELDALPCATAAMAIVELNVGDASVPEWKQKFFVGYLKDFLKNLEEKNARSLDSLNKSRIFAYFEQQRAKDRALELRRLIVAGYKALRRLEVPEDSKELK